MMHTLILKDEVPKAGEKILCRSPFNEQDRFYVTPSRVENLLFLVFDGKITVDLDGSIEQARNHITSQIFGNFALSGVVDIQHPKRFPVMVTDCLYRYLHRLWEEGSVVRELR